MEIIIALFFVILFITIPIGLFSIAAKKYGDGVKLPVVLVKLLVSILFYLPASIITPLFILFLAVGPDSGHGKMPHFGLKAQIICPLIVAVYALIGWLLCSFINGSFIKSYSEFNLSHEKPQPISLNKH